VAAIRARPWPRLPWWLWLAVVLTTVAMVVVGAGIFGTVPDQLPVAARRSPPTATQSHGVGDLRVPILEPENRDRLVRRQASCPRLDQVTLVGTAGEVALLDAAATKLCALRSTAPIQRARSGLRTRAVVQFAGFELTSTVDHRLRRGPAAGHGALKFQRGEAAADRVAVVLVHERARRRRWPTRRGRRAGRPYGRLDAWPAVHRRRQLTRLRRRGRPSLGDDASAMRLKEAGYR
jgi:hypothetical protein